jgi:dolichyl-phosphate beta-glucosyltransferase
MAQNNIERTVVIPAYAESSCIVSSLARLRDYLEQQQWLDTTEVVVVTADASDGTPTLVAEHIGQFPLNQHLLPGVRVGKGRDVTLGLRQARGAYVVFTDADLATPLHHLKTAFTTLEQSGGMVIGVRKLTSIHKAFTRRLSSVSANVLIRMVVGWDIRDSQCGFKGFTKQVVQEITDVSSIQNWGFDFEYIKIAKLRKIPIHFQPIPDWSDPKDASESLTGDSQWGAMKQTLTELKRVWLNTRRGVYERKN